MKLTFLIILMLGFSTLTLAQDEDDFDVVDEQAMQKAPTNPAAPTAVAVPQQAPAAVANRAPQSVAAPAQQPQQMPPQANRMPQATAPMHHGHHHCSATSENNISADLGRFCNPMAPFSITPMRDGMFFCCVKK